MENDIRSPKPTPSWSVDKPTSELFLFEHWYLKIILFSIQTQRFEHNQNKTLPSNSTDVKTEPVVPYINNPACRKLNVVLCKCLPHVLLVDWFCKLEKAMSPREFKATLLQLSKRWNAGYSAKTGMLDKHRCSLTMDSSKWS